jgi:hypothetical protein
MRKLNILIVILAFLPGRLTFSQDTYETELLRQFHAINSEEMMSWMQKLCSPGFNGRLTGTPEFIKSAEWMAAEFKEWGIKPAGDNGTYFQWFDMPYTVLDDPGSLSLNLSQPDGSVIRKNYKYPDEYYTPEGAKNLSNKELRKEYSRLRSIARKRLERFEGTEWTDTQVYKMNAGVYRPIDEIKSERELRHLLSDVSRFVMSDTGSVSGLEKQRKTAVKTLRERGYDFINKDNFRQFADFMEYARVANLNRLYDSKRIAEYFNEVAVKRKMSRDELYKNFRSWSKKQKKIKKIQNVNPRNSTQYRQGIE